MVQSSRGGKNGKLNETIEVSALWSNRPSTCHLITGGSLVTAGTGSPVSDHSGT